jgi:hypothetical protein
MTTERIGCVQHDCAVCTETKATIERLERDLVAADIRIENDKLEIASLHQQYADSMAHQNNAYNRRVAERDALKIKVEGLTREQVGLALDAARLVWAMNNMDNHNYVLFGSHVMNVGGTGDVHDCRSFIDAALKGKS